MGQYHLVEPPFFQKARLESLVESKASHSDNEAIGEELQSSPQVQY